MEKLKVMKRDVLGKKVKKYRKEGKIPAVIYGKGIENKNIWVNKGDFLKVYKLVGKTNILKLEGDDINMDVLVYDYQVDPVTNELLHVDFLAVTKGHKVHVEVPVEIVGKAPVEENGLGKVEVVKNILNVESVPSKIPEKIEVDISVLEKTNDVIFVKDLKLPKGLEILDKEDEAIVVVGKEEGVDETNEGGEKN